MPSFCGIAKSYANLSTRSVLYSAPVFVFSASFACLPCEHRTCICLRSCSPVPSQIVLLYLQSYAFEQTQRSSIRRRFSPCLSRISRAPQPKHSDVFSMVFTYRPQKAMVSATEALEELDAVINAVAFHMDPRPSVSHHWRWLT